MRLSRRPKYADWRIQSGRADLASADGLDDRSAKLAHQSKIIVHIDVGMHSTSVGASVGDALATKLIASPDDEEFANSLDNVIVVLWRP